MSAPRFGARVADAVGPILGLRGAELERRLDLSVALVADATDTPTVGWTMAANLLARLYPRIGLSGSRQQVEHARNTILAINPVCEVATTDIDDCDAALCWSRRPCDGHPTVWAAGANVYCDTEVDDRTTALPIAALIAAAYGVGEVFRAIFGAELGAGGRRASTQSAFNIVTLGEPTELPALLGSVDLGRIAIVGAGAIGQAATAALAVSGARARVCVIDPEPVELSNLQRYVLTRDTDESEEKIAICTDHLRAAGFVTDGVRGRWGAHLAAGRFDATLVGLDTEQDRIGVAASLPGVIYNAWTGEHDLGWSRHEDFGVEACLACLYWPTRARPHQHETLAREIGQHPLRVLAYLVTGRPGGAPLEFVPATPALPAPPEAASWSERSILDDIAVQAGVHSDRLAQWRDRPITDFHRDAICAGALLELDVGVGRGPVLVPLAHQSALAGFLLVVQLLVGRAPELRALRPDAIEARWNVLRPLPQQFPRPRARTAQCICSDPDWYGLSAAARRLLAASASRTTDLVAAAARRSCGRYAP